MGCEGCELVKSPDRKVTCYAKIMTARYAGRKGWPEKFESPKVFMERLPGIVNWSDLTDKERIDKPWLNGLPRTIFLNDMGDTFSKGLPYDWFADALPAMAASPHLYLVLTKWPARFADFSRRHKLPDNVCPGTSITSQKTIIRISQLSEVIGGGFKWLSVEPMWTDVQFPEQTKNMQWIIFGGESGSSAAGCEMNWIRRGVQYCRDNGINPFVKQLGSKPYDNAQKLILKDGHGGNMEEWPEDLRIREFPKVTVTP